MSINTVIRSQEFLNEFKNDIGFTANLGDFTNNFTGAVMERVKSITTIDVNWSDFISVSNPWTFDATVGNESITRTTGSWETEGFSVGDKCKWLQGGIFFADITILSISLDGLIIFYQLDSGSITNSSDASLFGVSDLTALIFKFGLIGNSETFNVESKVSGNDQGFYGSNIGFDTGGGVRDLNWVNMQRLGSYADWQTGTMRVRYQQSFNGYQRFEIEHVFMIVPYYLDGEISNLQNKIIPNLLNGTNTLKYAYNASFRTVLSNPNTQKDVTIDNNLGSVAWFGENFNGFNNDYEILSIDYTSLVTLLPEDGLAIGTSTEVEILVKVNNGKTFAPSSRFGVYVSYLPEQNEYQNKTTDLRDNFIYDRAMQNALLLPVNGDTFIKNVTGTVQVDITTMLIRFEVDYTAAQKFKLAGIVGTTGIPNYLIGVGLGDNALTSGNADRVVLIADVNQYDQTLDISDLMQFKTFKLYPHNKQIPVGGSTNLTAWNEDGFTVAFDFELNLNKAALLNTLDFKLITFNTVTEEYFELDSYSYNNIGNAIVSGGVQQLNENTTRGYILKSGDQFNEVTLNTGTLSGAGFQGYNGTFSQKFSWQDWIQNINADSIFYDATKPQNNLNFKGSNYSDLNNYEIRMSVLANVYGEQNALISGNTDYLFNSPNITLYDYTKDGNITPVWSGVIETFNNSNLSNLGGAILTGQDTLFRTTWTNSGGAVVSLTGIYGINRIEETGQLGYEITEMSSINEPAANQLLTPNSGTKLFVYLNAGNVVMECLIDGSLVAAGQSYNLSSRIHDDNLIIEGKITEQSVLKNTETSNQKIVE